ncbi:chaperonin Cpn10 [Cellulophaga phage phi4:1]|uniref:Chaperonin Cpn10 n=5 Tax=Lightbulbvirus TaxID=1918522 RepID=A0A0S2MWK4_9CAUD|nr:co-chaperonin GroES [Cellulophaga phage phi4:1]YP_008241593.1 co-chaperonin GroES [Cellulophaga phage phi17:2]ALO80105.1 chaperonin Cpn10 [Cellulophaga phage phi4:1_13]ALO80302.1 chaperonin Cpn10 [Cellulophaga phage phi4:1_18]ALO80501.1 chaperonin Cpn10 [Cellulophaga phage phi17:2_18]AGO47631.1 chaperonin Cpn10 [Cellulophaga phage phi17:2]AGO49509.1 chaperonin Cpn10 [Cellulophaga phage phi4:1]
MIWVKTRTKKQTDTGIILGAGQSWSSRLKGNFFEAEVIIIGSSIPKELLGDKDGTLEVGDTIFIQKWSDEIEWQRAIVVDNEEFLLLSTHDILGFEKKK